MEIAERFRILSDPTRLRILDVLREGEATVQQLTERIGGTQQNVSKHLQQLRAAGVVDVRRDGVRAWNCVADDSVFELCGLVCEGVERVATRRSSQITGMLRGS